MISLTLLSRSLKGRCYGNRFSAWIGENCHTQPSFIALAFHDGWKNRNVEPRVKIADDPSMTVNNWVNDGPVTSEFCRRVCAGRASRWALPCSPSFTWSDNSRHTTLVGGVRRMLWSTNARCAVDVRRLNADWNRGPDGTRPNPIVSERTLTTSAKTRMTKNAKLLISVIMRRKFVCCSSSPKPQKRYVPKYCR